MKAGQKVSKSGRWDIVVEFGTVPPKAGRLRNVAAKLLKHTRITHET